MVLLVVTLVGVKPAMSQYVTYVNESFTGATAPGWKFVKGPDHPDMSVGHNEGALLTAALDPPNPGWLRLTQDKTWQSSFVYYDTPIPTNLGMVFEFDFVIWGAASTLADGFTLAIFDANVDPAAGAYGGSLGYAQRDAPVTPGLAGGVIGVGFDEFGNYSRAREGRVGAYRTGTSTPGTELRPNSIAVRGSMNNDPSESYAYIAGTADYDSLTNGAPLDDFSKPNATDRNDATIHRVRITITPTRTLTVDWKKIDEENYTTVLSLADCNIDCPEEIKFGFTAGTGSFRAYHEIRNLEVRSSEAIPEPGALTLALGGGLMMAGAWWRRRVRASRRLSDGTRTA